MGEVGGVEPRGGCGRLVPVPPLLGETGQRCLQADSLLSFSPPPHTPPPVQQVGLTRGIPDVWRLHNSSPPRGDQSDQSCSRAAVPGGERSTWTWRPEISATRRSPAQQIF